MIVEMPRETRNDKPFQKLRLRRTKLRRKKLSQTRRTYTTGQVPE